MTMTKASLCPFSVHLTMCFANKTLIYHHLQCPFDIVSEGPKRTHHHSCPGPLSGSGSRNGILHSLQSAQRILFSSRLLYLYISHMCLASLSSSACCLQCLSVFQYHLWYCVNDDYDGILVRSYLRLGPWHHHRLPPFDSTCC